MRLLLIVNLFVCVSVSFAQVHVLKGKIIEEGEEQGIAYTNIGIEGTYYGTASDADGLFELKIPEDYAQKNIYFSAVGYENKIIPISNFSGEDFTIIVLKKQTYGIEGIDIAAQSKVLFRILRTASEKIRDNYLSGPIKMKIYYTEKLNEKKREAIVQLTDGSGYKNSSVLNAFKNRNYKFIEAKRDFEVYSFPQGTTGFDELLEADLARMGNTILNPDLVNDYDLQLESSTIFDGDSVWVIAYKTAKTDLSHTGDFYANKFNGKIYISKTDYGILRNELEIKSAKQNPQGRSLAIKQGGNVNVVNNITVGYKKNKDKYVLSFVNSKKQFTNADKQKMSITQALTVLDVHTDNVTPVISRDYVENVNFNSAFWENFISPKN